MEEQIMDKKKELTKALDMLIAGATAVRECLVAEEAVKDASLKAEDAPKVETEPAPKAYAFADVRKAFSAKSHEGYTEQIKSLITSYGAEKLSAIREADYPNLMKDLEAIK